jgi:hypothetical protein
MIIPPDRLESDTFQRLLEEFVTRDGTDNGDDTPLSKRVEQVKMALARKDAFIVYDSLSEQCNILLKQEITPEDLAAWTTFD